jgi:cytidyltransferase-like protein
MKTVIAGTFDLLHEGHLDLLSFGEMLAGHQDLLVVLINGDAMLINRKETAQDEDQRLANMEHLIRNCAVIHTMDQLRETVKSQAPCFLLHGNDWNKKTLSDVYGVSEEWWEEHGIYLVYKDRYPGVSSTQKRKELREE